MPKPASRFDAESVRASWDQAAGTYAQGQASGSDYYRYEFFGPAQLALCGEVRGLRVLDVGCGNGYFARALTRLGARVTGIDISPRMIEHARQQELAGPLGIDYHVLDAAVLPAGFLSTTARLRLCGCGRIWRTRPGCRTTCFSTSCVHRPVDELASPGGEPHRPNHGCTMSPAPCVSLTGGREYSTDGTT
jgi:SAM-dependent methyltransferase